MPLSAIPKAEGRKQYAHLGDGVYDMDTVEGGGGSDNGASPIDFVIDEAKKYWNELVALLRTAQFS